MKRFSPVVEGMFRSLNRLRSVLLARFIFRFEQCGAGFVCGKNCFFSPRRRVVIGNRVFIGPGAYVVADLTIGDDVLFGPQVMILGGDHQFRIPGKVIRDSGAAPMVPVVIGDDCWVGARTLILKGVTVGTGSIVAASSLVLKDVEPFSIVGGQPAKVIGRRFEGEMMQEHLRILAAK